MTKTKRFFSFALVLTLVVSMLSIFSVSASAATGKSRLYDAFKTVSFSVTTNRTGNPSMTFKSTGTGSYQYGAKAPILSLKVYNHSNKSTQYYRVTGTRWYNSVTSTLKLKANTKYTVTVSYMYNKSLNWGTYGLGMYETTGWYQGSWQLTSTSKLSYSIK